MKKYLLIATLFLFTLSIANSQWSQFYKVQPDVAGCKHGQLLDTEKQKVLDEVNLIRALHNLEPVVYNTAYDEQSEKAALMMVANNALSHQPPSSWKCYTQAGFDGAEHTNLYISSTSGSTVPTTEASITAWMIDNPSEVVGHRRWIIDPFLKFIAMGRADGKNGSYNTTGMALYVIDNEKRDISAWDMNYVAYPYEYYSPKYVFLPNGDWHLLSFTYIADKTNYWNNSEVKYSSAKVTMKDENGVNIGITTTINDNQGYGVPNCFKWKPAELKTEVKYEITISDILVGGSKQTVSYWFKLTDNIYTEVPDKPVLSAPADKSQAVSNLTGFAWKKNNNASKFGLQVATDKAFKNKLIDDQNIATNAYQPTTKFADDTEIFWRVRAYNDAGWGEVSEVWSFITGSDQLPNKPNLLLPENGSTTAMESHLVWNKTEFAAEYLIVVSTSEDLAPNSWDVFISETTTDTSYQILAKNSFEIGTQYWWLIKSVNDNGEKKSDIWTFTIQKDDKLIVKLTAPANGSKNMSLTPTLVWKAVNGATGYNLQVSTDEDFEGDDLVITKNKYSETEYAIPADRFKPATEYNWRVAAIIDENALPWSDVWHFGTGKNTEIVANLLIPVDEALNVPLEATFSWSKIATATYYEIQVADKDVFDGSSMRFEETNILDTTVKAKQGKLRDSVVYWWRVRGVYKPSHTPDFYPWSYPRIFSTYDKLPNGVFDSRITGIDVQTYPNPAINSINILLDIEETDNVVLFIFDSNGKIINTVQNGLLTSGIHVFDVNVSDLTTGVYYYHLVASDGTKSGKFIKK